MKNILISTKKFAQRHKEALVVGAVATTVIVLQTRGINSLNTFLKEKDLFEEYYLSDLV